MTLEIDGVLIMLRAVESLQVVQTTRGGWAVRVTTASGAQHDKFAETEALAEQSLQTIVRNIFLSL